MLLDHGAAIRGIHEELALMRELLRAGLSLWRPRFLISIINTNDRISWVQPTGIGQTMVN
jgi:hypothetical protein